MDQKLGDNDPEEEWSSRGRGRRKVIVVGGSIAGLSCAKALVQPQCQCDVLVLERASSLTAAGAGLGLDIQACRVLQEWGLTSALASISMPLTVEEIRAIDPQSKSARVLARDEELNHRSAHWSDVHRILFEALPQGIVEFGQEVVGFEEIDEGRRIRAKVKPSSGDGNEIKDVVGDLFIAADGINSSTRQRLVSSDKRHRYCGYCAWRGVFDYSEQAAEEIAAAVRKAYVDLGKCLYFDLAPGSHAVLYELAGKRLNWLWYVCQEEPNLKGISVTIKADESMVKKMHEEASRTFMPELALLMQSTKFPFVNAIFDRDPLKQIVWGHVVLVGEAAHPTSPHGIRSTNMSIMDAAVLGSCIAECKNLDAALCSYQNSRLPVTTQQVLFSRHLGKLKQGLLSVTSSTVPWMQADKGTCLTLLQRNVHLFQF
ncbi:hypothetical protein O6H91_16G081800 [Diphasiastrum complanatum]|uniref:Uncharacterized protein n=1 Tax=Diphasiastrum complanatum TaxID=34168 RepID=A0ACC2BEC0_DIPCM|nr:hypothetical protein O6H91_16G081800 [Diphasiastrum complanatum]